MKKHLMTTLCNLKRYTFLFLSLLLTVSSLIARSNSDEIEALLDSLDLQLEHSAEIDSRKHDDLAALTHKFAGADNTEEKYWRARELYEGYSCFDSDSALFYADKAYAIAARLNKPLWMAEMDMNKAYVYSATGLHEEAQQCLDRIDEMSLPTKMRIEYYERQLFTDTHRDQFLGDNAKRVYSATVANRLDSLCNALPDSDPETAWLRGWHSLSDTLRAEKLIPLIENDLRSASFSTVRDAKESWMLSRLYDMTNNAEGRVKYLILSALADIRSGNKEIASLEELAGILLDKGDLEHANAYISYCIMCANDYKSRVRVGRLSAIQEQVHAAINRELGRQITKVNHYNFWITVVSIVLFFALVFILMQMRQLKRTRKALGDTKEKLEERVGELQDMRTELEQANTRLSELYESARSNARELAAVNDAKETYIANIFALCSTYISKLDDFRKNIYRMIVARRFDDVMKLTQSPDLSHGEIKELYANFDKIFLQIYPDFIADFNTLLRPDEQISPRKGELLTTELRIYALVRLGINDSVKIAKFLHCSVQTVYNTRQRARNKAAVPKESFAEAVRGLGKPSI